MKQYAWAAAAVLLLAIGILAADVLRHPQYTPDGIVYARFAARAAGYSERDATLAARAFYERTPLMQTPRYRALVELDPSVAFARSKIFANRVLYPWTVAALLPIAGFRALFIVSALAYLAFSIALFWTLLPLGRPWIAALLTAAAIALPVTRAAAASDLTDMFALVWWTIALGALLRGLRDSGNAFAIVVAVAGVLFALARPTPYLLVVPGAAAAIVSGRLRLFLAACGGAVAFACVAVATHAFGVIEQLRWVYEHRPGRTANLSEAAWYRGAISGTLRYAAVQAVRTVLPIAALAACVFCIVRNQRRAEAIVLAAAAAACLISIPFNPVPSSLARIVFLPLLPVMCAMLQCALPAELRARSAVPQEIAA